MSALIIDGQESTDPARADAILYSAEVVSVIFAGLGGSGWHDGCALTAHSPADGSRALGAGEVWVDGALVSVSAQPVGPVTAHAQLDRWAFWSVDANGLGHVDLGTPAIEPLPPRLADGRAPLGLDIVRANVGVLTGSPTVDLRAKLRSVASEPAQHTVASTGSGAVTVSGDAGLVIVTVTADIGVTLDAGQVGVPVRVLFVQDSTGGWDVTSWASDDGPILWAGGTAGTLWPDAGTKTEVSAVFDGTAWLADYVTYLAGS